MQPQFTQRPSRAVVRYPNQIREYRLKAGLTQRQLARRIGTHRSMISSWERGTVIPSVPSLFKLARALDTLAESLYMSLYAPKRTDQESIHPRPE